MSITVPMEGFGGGSNPLNFKVVGNPQPENPKVNTIWIDTDVPITSWILSPTEPNVYNATQGDDPYEIRIPEILSDGDIVNFTIPVAITSVFEAIRIKDNAGKLYYIRVNNGGAGTAWYVGVKVPVRISSKSYPIGSWGSDGGSAIVFGWGNYSHDEGTVWFPTGEDSNVNFNALKKNAITVYPLSAKQYVGGEWVSKDLMIYQNGAWVTVNDYFYYARDNTFIQTPTVSATEGASLISFSGNVLSWKSGTLAGGFQFSKTDVTNRKKLYAKLSYTAGANLGHFRLGLGGAVIHFTEGTTVTEKVYELDISSVTGEQYPSFYVQGGGGKGAVTITVHDLYLI